MTDEKVELTLEEKLKEQVKELNDKLSNSVDLGEQKINGFRKGITKKDIIKSMTNEDWKFLDKVKEAELIYHQNKLAGDLFIQSDQAVQEMKKIKSTLLDSLANVLLLNHEMAKSKIEIKLGSTERKDEQGIPISLDELHYLNIKTDSKIKIALSIMCANLSRLFTFVGKSGFDKTILLMEDDFDGFAKNIMVELEKTPYKLY